MAPRLKRLLLDDAWQFKAVGGGSCPDAVRLFQPAAAPPTTVHLDLLRDHIIPDPFLAKNEDDVQWVGEQIWVYRTTFTIPRDATHLRTELVFEGLDTYATVTLNDRVILESNNMFLTHRVDITDAISERVVEVSPKHVLELRFDDAEKRGDAIVEQHPEHKWVTFNSGLGRLATRKAQYHYGWDWGPKLMTSGPWRPIYLEAFQSRLSDVAVEVFLAKTHQFAELSINVEVEGTAECVAIEVKYEGFTVASARIEVSFQKARTKISLQNPHLWWPHTFGSQCMYDVDVMLIDNIAGESVAIDSSSKRIGIRTVELVRQPYESQEGESFYFRINGIDIFCAGSNWIPGDLLLPRITPTRYREWIELARASSQVMIRIWGGGAYEPEAFYNACDELGLLVWQDFMFACGMFPAYPEFLATAKLEAEQNVRLLRHHPSIVLWCGNNEDYVIPLLSGIEYDASEKRPEKILESIFPSRYTYEYLLPEVCQRLSPGTPYWPGSPYGGEMVNSPAWGDIHQWHVWHLEKFPYQDFPRLTGRFVSEFGMQAFPCHRTTLEYFPKDHDVESRRDWAEDEYVLQHNKAGGGQETLNEYCDSNIRYDSQSLRRYIHATQLIQSEAVSTAYKSWRRAWGKKGERTCGGALIWQLNDCSPVTSWALADYHLRPKLGFWAMKRENKPITAGLQRAQKDGAVAMEIWATNTSLQEPVVDVVLKIWSVSSARLFNELTLESELKLPLNQTSELGTVALAELVKNQTTDYKDVVVAVELRKTGGNVLSRNVSFHEPLLEVPFRSTVPTFDVQFITLGGKEHLRLSSPVALKGVMIEADDAFVDRVRWADNGFDLLPNEVVHVEAQGLEPSEDMHIRISWLGGGWNGGNLLRAVL